MHDTAMEYGEKFFSTYLGGATGLKIVDIGAQDVNGSLRSVAPKGNEYVGVDFVEGRGVDVIIDDPYSLPFETGSADAIVSSSCLEHSEFFWLVFLEMLRVLKPTGLLYINAPSNGHYHRWPVDCWRFYPDSGVALQNWARRSGTQAALLESFIGRQKAEPWNDFVGVFVKDEAHADRYPRRMVDGIADYTNATLHGVADVRNFAKVPEDQEGGLGRALKKRFPLLGRIAG